MKHTDDPKMKVDNTQSEKEVKNISGEAKDAAKDEGLRLDNEDLDQVAGGFQPPISR